MSRKTHNSEDESVIKRNFIIYVMWGTCEAITLSKIKWDITYSHHCYHQRQITLPAWIPLTLSFHLCLSFIAPGRSCRLYPVSVQSWCRSVLACRTTLARPWVEIHRRIPSSVPHVFFVLLGWLLWWEVSGCTTVVLWGVASRICSK